MLRAKVPNSPQQRRRVIRHFFTGLQCTLILVVSTLVRRRPSLLLLPLSLRVEWLHWLFNIKPTHSSAITREISSLNHG